AFHGTRGENCLKVDQFRNTPRPSCFAMPARGRYQTNLLGKGFPEITIKSAPVPKGVIPQLVKNIRTVSRDLDSDHRVARVWDNIEVETDISDVKVLRDMIERLRCTPGIGHCLEVHEYTLGDLDDIFEKCKAHFADRLPGKIFAVRCKRAGKHSFSSMDVER